MPERSHSTSNDLPMGEESPRLSTASIGSNERSSTATLSDLSDFPNGQRPMSLVSTLSSGSGSSRDDNPPSANLTAEAAGEYLDLERNSAGDNEGQEPLRDAGKFARCNNNNGSVPSSAPLSPFAASTMAPNPQLTYLDRVVMEIIETERMYVRDLRSIVEDYLAQIIDMGDLPIRPEQVCALFGNIEDIYEFNSELLQSLDMCDNDPVAIAQCFVLKRDYFDIYTQYCTNYPNSVAALTECMRNKTLAKFFRERQATLKRSLPLGSYLLKPVQRILKYHLLLQEIAKHFDPEEEGYEVVEEAIYTMTGVAWYINDMKRKHEHAVRLQEVQSLLINWKGPDLTTYGELVLEGTFRVHRAKNERTLFLFDRMLLITKRRGEHYVYKAHISCSTLMLIESAKDSLCFSVTHYKHPKQPHTVQAKTVEERKLWAHHIKRLILENHQAIIPQKAKEAILEKDSIYRKYRYSPERLKKATSCQSDEFPNCRQGRRQSEPTKQIIKTTKGLLKHADSEGAIPGDVRPLQSAASVSTLGSSLGEPEAERPSLEEEESLERLCPSDLEEPPPESPASKDRLNQEVEEEEEEEEEDREESDSDDILMEDDQVADFASSMLAAISCWHYRARALLSMGFTTNEDGSDNIEENNFKKENGQSSVQEEPHVSEDQVISEQALEDNQENLRNLSDSDFIEKLQADPLLDTEPVDVDLQVSNTEVEQPETKDYEGDQKEEPEAASPGSQVEESTGESSEDEYEAEDASQGQEPNSILPSSVLDKASAIAEHFVSHTRRSSLATDEGRSLGCPSPRLPSRTGSSLSLGGDALERAHRLGSTSSEPQCVPLTQEALAGADFTFLSPRDDNPFESDHGIYFEPDRSIHRRRDSTLSKQDQLLIDKIKSYYENAEHQDANFSLKRRESLTYIPAGLVRNSVSRFNSIPKNDAFTTDKTTSLTVTSASAETKTPSGPLSIKEQGYSSTSFDSLESSKDKVSEPSNSLAYESEAPQTTKIKSQSFQDEEFRPSSEMIKVWQDMEKEVSRSQGELRALRPRECPYSRGASPGLSRKIQHFTKSMDAESSDYLISHEQSDLSTITEESSSPSPVKEKGGFLQSAASVDETLTPPHSENECGQLRPQIPKVVQLRAETDEVDGIENTQSLEDEERAKNKVLHLARKYSQYIKCTKPVVRQRSREGEGILAKRNLPCVLEEKPEKETKVKPNLTLSLTAHDQMPQHEMGHRIPGRSSSPGHTASSVSSPRVLSPSRQHLKSPLSPTPVENFNWPDVRELRSKYALLEGASVQLPSVSRTRSVPEKMRDCGPRRRSSCSSSIVLSSESTEASTHGSHLRRDVKDGHARIQRAGSLDHKLSGLYLSDLQSLQNNNPNGGYYISAQATLPNDKKIIVIEKVPEVTPQVDKDELVGAAPEPLEEVSEREDTDDTFVQIRSPTSKEKISIMAVIDRCRAYQESEEYRQRDDGGAKAESATKSGRTKELDIAQPSNEQLDDTLKNASQQNMVKNLREKFQSLR
ncbi:pleckstrin homology domain-containing family G member 3 [Chanos chanos]|uniref:Pleckstrin homology domain-containing family G member 3 n=1 Tax=Chanos chanos TaxID=29144 RepID=A0A6J2V4R9_CHACN|nr:pleckstrin homology domain-containing family G member 3 [Chanos chanos]